MAAGVPKWLKITLAVAGGIVVLVLGLGFIVQYQKRAELGTKLEITAKESVYYSGSATEADAKSLGEALKTHGYFDGSTVKDVLISKGTGGTVLSFVVQDGFWDKPDIVAGFQTMGRALAPTVGGLPLTIRLVDSGPTTKHEEILK